AQYQVSLKRTETWLAEIVIEADSPEEARERVEQSLADEGWDSVCNDQGNYDECTSEVTDVRPLDAEDADGPAPRDGCAPDQAAPSVPHDEAIPITFTHVDRYRRRTYHAGGIHLSLGGGPGIGHVAMRVDPDGTKWATTDDT